MHINGHCNIAKTSKHHKIETTTVQIFQSCTVPSVLECTNTKARGITQTVQLRGAGEIQTLKVSNVLPTVWPLKVFVVHRLSLAAL